VIDWGTAPRWAICCQGAAEVDGMRMAADGSRVEVATPVDCAPGSGWVMYLGPDDRVRWDPCHTCPMCGGDLRPLPHLIAQG
jgi:hypothetical protein